MDNSYRNYERGPGWLAVLLISLIVSCAVVAGFQWASLNGHLPALLTEPAHNAPALPPEKAESIKVPRVTGLPMSVASELLAARGLRLVVTDKREDELAPADTVVSQEPLSDSVVPENSPVNVVVSMGPAAGVAVPDVTGQTVEQAKAALEAAGLILTPLAESDPKEGMVDSTLPAATQSVARGSAVKLVLKSATGEVPRVVGMPFGRAKKVLEAAGFKIGKVRDGANDTRESDEILRQAPEPGARAAQGSTVDLVRNEGY